MSELKAFRIIQGDTGGYGAPSYKCNIDGNRIDEWSDTCEVYDRFEADKVIKDIVKGASSMFREFSCCRGLDTKSPLGKIADAAYKHWMRDSITENENKQLKDEKDRLLYDNRQLLDRTFQLEKHVISQDRQVRHQKYKRCLDKAMYWLAVSYQCVDDKCRQRAGKHHYKWLELAEKLKVVK